MSAPKVAYDLPPDAPSSMLREAGEPKQFFLSDKKWIELTGAKGFIAMPPQPATSIR